MVSTEFALAVAQIAPLYNITLIFIAFFLLLRLVRLGKANKTLFLKPWYFLFGGMCMFLLESIITVLKVFGYVTDALIPRWFNAVFELILIVLVIYMLFIQANHVTEKYKKKRKRR